MRGSCDHSIVSVDLVKRKPKEMVRGLCDTHSQPIEFFDTSCQHFSCIQCVLLTHNGHTLQALDKAAEVFRNRIGEFVDRLSAETQRMKLAEDDVIRVHEDLSSHCLQCKINLTNSFAKVTKQSLISSSSLTVQFLIHIFFDQIREALNERERDLHTQLKNLHKKKAFVLEVHQKNGHFLFQNHPATVTLESVN
jgi:hypothetical protein